MLVVLETPEIDLLKEASTQTTLRERENRPVFRYDYFIGIGYFTASYSLP